MKVYEYIPLYGLLFNFEYQTGIDGEKMTVNEMFDNYPDFELTDIHIDQLYYFDLASLQKVLEGNYFTPETVVSYLRELFDNYRQSGGNPFDWLQGTFESINLNPQNYKAELRATLEKTLLEWIEIFNKLPIDYLYYNTNPEALPPQQTETKTEQEQQTENDFTLSTIEDWLFPFKEKMNENDYQTLVSALKQYFDIGTFPTLSKPIQINGRINKKLFGWSLNRIFEAKGKGIEKELLQFAKQNISLFNDVQFDETNILNSNLYKYFTTKTK
jgi:hypothetical protein